MINKILKIIEEHIVLDKDLQKVIKAEYPYKETLSSDIDDLFALHVVSQQRELLLAFDNMREFDIKHDDIEESVDYFLKNKESYL